MRWSRWNGKERKLPELPPAPENVRIVLPDGEVIPVEVFYNGRNVDGLHEWVATVPIPIWVGCSIKADAVPPYTSILAAVVDE